MNKQEFLTQLRQGLAGLPQADIEDHIFFYNEMIDDRMEEGIPEELAVREIGTVDEVIEQIIAETPLTKLVKEKVKPKRSLQAWEIALLIIGSPIWLSLLIALFAVILSVYVTLWAVIVALWSVVLALGAAALACIAASAVLAVSGQGLTGVVVLGAGILCAGLTIFTYFGCLAATKGIVRLTKKFAYWIKSLFIGKEDKNEQNS